MRIVRDVRLLTASYWSDQGEPVVELTGRTREGESIAIICRGFRPYMHVRSPDADTMRVLEDARLEGLVREWEECTLRAFKAEEPALKVYTRNPSDVPRLRDRFFGIGQADRVYSADILFRLRFIYDRDIGACVRVTGTQLTGADRTTNLVILSEGMEAIEPFHPDLSVMSFDIENAIRTGQLFCIGCVLRRGGELEKRVFDGTEAEMLSAFETLVREWDPDVITGYNIDRYDLMKLEERCKAIGRPPLLLGRDGTELREGKGQRHWDVNGRVIADAWWNAKKVVRPKRETLNFMAQMLLGESKDDVDPRRMDEEWEADPEKVKSYCVKDAELALRILEKVRTLDRNMDLATVAKLPLDEVLNGSTSVLIDSILIRAADRQGVAVPMTRKGREYGQIAGGYVHSLEAGVYHWVNVLDFKSMYPSLIIANNICFTTLDPKGEIVSPDIAAEGSPERRIRFLARSDREGIVPGILSNLMAERDSAKKAAKSAKDEATRSYYSGLQEAIKILMNSFYGVFASSFYRFTDRDIGASITAFARDNTQRVIRELEGEGIEVIYGDTDSIFYKSPKEDLDGAVGHGKEVSKRYSVEGASLEFEKVLNPFFSHGAKKRYVGKSVWPALDELVIRGYEVRRTDSFNAQNAALMEVFELLMEEDTDGAVQVARTAVDRIAKGDVPLIDLVISKTVKDEGSYDNPESMANVRVKRAMEEAGHEVVSGMKISWIVTNARKSPQEVTPFVDEASFVHKPDYEYYAKRVAGTLGRITEVFGWDERSLLHGQQQATLAGFGGEGEDTVVVESKRKPADKKPASKLEDFF